MGAILGGVPVAGTGSMKGMLAGASLSARASAAGFGCIGALVGLVKAGMAGSSSVRLIGPAPAGKSGIEPLGRDILGDLDPAEGTAPGGGGGAGFRVGTALLSVIEDTGLDIRLRSSPPKLRTDAPLDDERLNDPISMSSTGS